MIVTLRRVALAAYAVFLLTPFYWMVNLSFQPNNDILKSVEVFPHGISHKNYLTVLGDSVWASGFFNGLIYAGLSTIIALAVALPAAYAISRRRFRGRQVLLGWLLANRMVPPVVFVAVYFEAARATALFDSYTAVALAHCLFTVPLAMWLLRRYMDQVSRHLDEAALLDGFRAVGAAAQGDAVGVDGDGGAGAAAGDLVAGVDGKGGAGDIDVDVAGGGVDVL